METSMKSGLCFVVGMSAVLFVLTSMLCQCGDTAMAQENGPQTSACSAAASSRNFSQASTQVATQKLEEISKRFSARINLTKNDSTLAEIVQSISEQMSKYPLSVKLHSSVPFDLREKTASCDFKDEPFWNVVLHLMKNYDLGIKYSRPSATDIQIEFVAAESDDCVYNYLYIPPMAIMLQKAKIKGTQNEGTRLWVLSDPAVLELFEQPIIRQVVRESEKCYEAVNKDDAFFHVEGGQALYAINSSPKAGEKRYIDMTLKVIDEFYEVKIPAETGEFFDKTSGMKINVTASSQDANGNTKYECQMQRDLGLKGDLGKKYDSLFSPEALPETKGMSDYDAMAYRLKETKKMLLDNDLPFYEMVSYSCISRDGKDVRSGNVWYLSAGRRIKLAGNFVTKDLDTQKLQLVIKFGRYKLLPLSVKFPIETATDKIPTSAKGEL